MRKISVAIAILSAIVILGFAQSTLAGSASSNLQVSVTVDAACAIDTTAVSFPDYEPIGAHQSAPDDSSSGSVTVTCTPGAAPTISLSLGNYASGSQARMSNGASSFVDYTLYQDAAHLFVWGSGANSLSMTPAPDTDPRTVTVYGRIPGGQTPAPGSHSDLVVATVNF